MDALDLNVSLKELCVCIPSEALGEIYRLINLGSLSDLEMNVFLLAVRDNIVFRPSSSGNVDSLLFLSLALSNKLLYRVAQHLGGSHVMSA